MKQFKRGLSYVLVLMLIIGLMPAYAASTFNDVQGHWAQNVITKWSDSGYINGYPDSTFKPDGKITRAEFLKLLDNVVSFKYSKPSMMNDVNTSDWYNDVVQKGVANHVVNGYPSNEFKPDNNITREEAVVVLDNLLKLAKDNGAKVSKYNDGQTTSNWAKGSMSESLVKGYIKGYENNTLRPKDNITRAETVTLLDRVFGQIVTGSLGSSNEQTVIDGNLTLINGDVTLTNVVIEGDLYIAEGVSTESLLLKGVIVKGNIIVKGGGNGKNGLVFDDVKVEGSLVLARIDDETEIIVKGNTNIDDTVLYSSAVLREDKTLTGKGFENVAVASEADFDTTAYVYGDVAKVKGDNAQNVVKVVDNKKTAKKTSSTGRSSSSSSSSSGSSGSSTPTKTTPEAITVTFDTGNAATTTSASITAGKTVNKPADPVKDGYIFKGWMLNDKLFDFNKTLDNNTKLVAKWEQLPFEFAEGYPKVIKDPNNSSDDAYILEYKIDTATTTSPAIVFASFNSNSRKWNTVDDAKLTNDMVEYGYYLTKDIDDDNWDDSRYHSFGYHFYDEVDNSDVVEHGFYISGGQNRYAYMTVVKDGEIFGPIKVKMPDKVLGSNSDSNSIELDKSYVNAERTKIAVSANGQFLSTQKIAATDFKVIDAAGKPVEGVTLSNPTFAHEHKGWANCIVFDAAGLTGKSMEDILTMNVKYTVGDTKVVSYDNEVLVNSKTKKMHKVSDSQIAKITRDYNNSRITVTFKNIDYNVFRSRVTSIMIDGKECLDNVDTSWYIDGDDFTMNRTLIMDAAQGAGDVVVQVEYSTCFDEASTKSISSKGVPQIIKKAPQMVSAEYSISRERLVVKFAENDELDPGLAVNYIVNVDGKEFRLATDMTRFWRDDEILSYGFENENFNYDLTKIIANSTIKIKYNVYKILDKEKDEIYTTISDYDIHALETDWIDVKVVE